MPINDAMRWNARYQDARHESALAPSPLLIEYAPYLPKKGLALDAAMGVGSNAGRLIERGLRVIGVDISEVAVRRAKERFPRLMAAVVDLTRWHLPPAAFDVILNFFYLERSLWPQYVHALRPGGWLLFETPISHPRGMNSAHLLALGELARAFAALDIVEHHQIRLETSSPHPIMVTSAEHSSVCDRDDGRH